MNNFYCYFFAVLKLFSCKQIKDILTIWMTFCSSFAKTFKAEQNGSSSVCSLKPRGSNNETQWVQRSFFSSILCVRSAKRRLNSCTLRPVLFKHLFLLATKAVTSVCPEWNKIKFPLSKCRILPRDIERFGWEILKDTCCSSGEEIGVAASEI